MRTTLLQLSDVCLVVVIVSNFIENNSADAIISFTTCILRHSKEGTATVGAFAFGARLFRVPQLGLQN